MNNSDNLMPPARAVSEKSGQMGLDGRNEKRVTMAIPVCLVIAEKLLFADQAMTVNVSSHGARIITRRRWQLEEQPRLASSSGELWAQAKVVYCEPLTDGHFCIGLQFRSAIMDWKPT
ncbi:MAG TPA: PilZ domain-containing protein [Candidatus Acidoferrum sp.]|nr:PilZ domain-containing protein [Candidatus Acidoferrum sp.]